MKPAINFEIVRIMKNILFLIPFIFFSSCATLILRKDYNIRVLSDVPNAKAEVLDSVYNLPTEFKIKRSKQDLKIKLVSDIVEKDYLVKSSPNGAFLYGNLIWLQLSPAAYLIDLTNQKRFYYGKSIFLKSSDTLGIIRPISNDYYNYWTKSFPTIKGQLNFTYSLPWVNSFYLQPSQESAKINTGFWGISAGLEYYYKDNKYIALTGNAVMDFFIPFPAAVDFSGERENMYSVYTSLTDNYRLGRLSLGYGLNFSRNTWELVYHDRFNPPPPTRNPATKSSNSIGLTLDGYHQIGKHFYLGLIYRPSLLNVYPNFKLKYEHLISIDFKWKFKLTK